MTVQAKKTIKNRKIHNIKDQKVPLKNYPQKKIKGKLYQ
jgi:hypothetical protein